MSINTKMWQVKNGNLENIDKMRLPDEDIIEEKLEDWIEKDCSILDENILIIARQYDEIDLLGIRYLPEDENEIEVVIIENKRDRTPREVVAQVLDYASKISSLEKSDFIRIAEDYYKRNNKGSFRDAFREKFDGADIEDEDISLRREPKLIIMAGEIDEITERIINFLVDFYDMDINAFSFSFFKNKSEEQFLVRNILMSEQQKEISGGKIRREPRGKRVTILDLINAGFVTIGDEITADYDSKHFIASISQKGGIIFEGMEFESLSSAGETVKRKCGRTKDSTLSTQGTIFWKHKGRIFKEIIDEYKQNQKVTE